MEMKRNVRRPDLVLFFSEIVFGVAVGVGVDHKQYGAAGFIFTFALIMAIDRASALVQRAIETATAPNE